MKRIGNEIRLCLLADVAEASLPRMGHVKKGMDDLFISEPGSLLPHKHRSGRRRGMERLRVSE